MKKLRLLSFMLFALLATMSACFEQGDDILPTPTAPADNDYLIGNWKVYKSNSPYIEKGGTYVDAAVYIRADKTLTIYRKGVFYEGVWDSNREGYVGFQLNDAASLPEVPGQWSIQRADSDELWLSTSIKSLYMRRFEPAISK
jgi:hypothetical protein